MIYESEETVPLFEAMEDEGTVNVRLRNIEGDIYAFVEFGGANWNACGDFSVALGTSHNDDDSPRDYSKRAKALIPPMLEFLRVVAATENDNGD